MRSETRAPAVELASSRLRFPKNRALTADERLCDPAPRGLATPGRLIPFRPSRARSTMRALPGGVVSLDEHLADLPECCRPEQCRCECGCRAHSHLRRCRLCAHGLHDAARAFLADPRPDRLAHLLPHSAPLREVRR